MDLSSPHTFPAADPNPAGKYFLATLTGVKGLFYLGIWYLLQNFQ